MSKLKRFPTYEELFPEGKLDLNSYNLESLTNLVSVVVNKYFSVYNDNEEFISIGLCKVIEVLQEGLFDRQAYPGKHALKNFLYTTTRNAISNHVYHQYNPNKEVLSDTLPETSIYAGDSQAISIYYLNTFVEKSIFNIDVKVLYSYLVYLGYPIEPFHEYRTSLANINEYFYSKIVCILIRDFFNSF